MRFEQADALLQAVRSIAVRHRALTAAFLAPLNLYPGQEVILLELAASGPRTQSELAAVSGCEPPTITGCARKLEAAGLITRHPSPTDARVSIVELTEQGKALIPALKTTWRALADATVATMTTSKPTGELIADLADLARSIVVAEDAHTPRNIKRRHRPTGPSPAKPSPTSARRSRS